MSKSKKPRKAYNPNKCRLANQHPLAIAGHGCSQLTKADQEAVIAPIHVAIDAFRKGNGKPHNVAAFNTAFLVLKHIEKKRIITEMTQYIEDAERVIEAICRRAHDGDIKNPWKAPTLYSHELEALYVLRDLFAHALSVVSVREIADAEQYFYARSKSDGAKILPYNYHESVQ